MRCVILDDYQNVALEMADWSPLDGRVATSVHNDHIADPDRLAAALEGVEIVVAMRERTPFDRALFERLPALRLLITTGAANASIDVAAAAEHGITVCGTRSFVGSTAELAFGLLLAVVRHIPSECAAMRANGRWQSSIGRDLNGLTLGIVGFGKLGSRVAKFGQAFDMRVAAWSRSLTEETARGLGIDRCGSLGELLGISDVVSIHLKLTPETRGLIGAAEFDRMKPGAVLINTSRGPIVDEAAMIAALRDGRLGGAGLDVYDQEPLPAGHPLRRLDNVVATPHLGYVTRNSYRAFFPGVVEDIVGWLDGTPVRVISPAS